MKIIAEMTMKLNWMPIKCHKKLHLMTFSHLFTLNHTNNLQMYDFISGFVKKKKCMKVE